MFSPRTSIRVLDEESEDGRNTLYFAELAPFMGPLTLAQPGSGTIEETHGRPWAIELRRDDNKLHAYRLVNDSWLEQTSQLPPIFQDELSEDVRRVSAAGDQSARLVVAYEENDEVKVTRWDPAQGTYVQNVQFSGTNPVLLMDALIQNRVAGSDIILFYQRPDEPNRIYYRLQAELYGTENLLYEHPEPLILDRANVIPFRYQLLASDEDGNPLDDAQALMSLISEIYPINVRDDLDLHPSETQPLWSHELRIITYQAGNPALELNPAPAQPAWPHVSSTLIYNSEPVEIELGPASEQPAWSHVANLFIEDAEPAALALGPTNLQADWPHVVMIIPYDAGDEEITLETTSTQPAWVHQEVS